MCRCKNTTKCIIWMFSEESLWSFLKLLFVIHQNKQTISGTKVDFLEDKSSLQTKNWRYSAVSQTTGTLPVYSWQERRHTILFLLSPASQSLKRNQRDGLESRCKRSSAQKVQCRNQKRLSQTRNKLVALPNISRRIHGDNQHNYATHVLLLCILKFTWDMGEF